MTDTHHLDIHASIEKLRTNIKTAIKGKDEAIDLALTTLIARGHLLIEDAPGVGKTTLAESLAKSIGLQFSRIQFTSDLLPSDVLGVTIYNQSNHEFQFKQGPIFSNIVLADEINRATPKTQSALLEAMSEKQISMENSTYKLPDTFMLIATQNPIEYSGTFPLPESQLDRFTMRLSLGYPDEAIEAEILMAKSSKGKVETVPVITGEELKAIQTKAEEVTIDEDLVKYIVSIAKMTREHVDILLGVSTRASLSLVTAVKAYALVLGRDFVTADDIKTLVVPAFSHRIVTRQDRESLATGELILREILDETPVPL